MNNMYIIYKKNGSYLKAVVNSLKLQNILSDSSVTDVRYFNNENMLNENYKKIMESNNNQRNILFS